MIREDTFYSNEIEFVEKPHVNGYDLIAKIPDYKNKFFYSDYVEWLINTDYIKEM